QNINEEANGAKPVEKSKGLGALLGKLGSAGESGLTRVLFNMPFVLFLAFLAALHIANNHTAENYARRITKTEKEVKQLRWQYMTTASGLMRISKQSEVAKLVDKEGIVELRIPPYKIEAPAKPDEVSRQ
ncbi:MAG TPA: FtsL-like putative cell division protein, partial [Chitinophagales bacterium]|nr:FtsL-like putative cell division protein [Chitinophagales bacterium]